MRTISNAIGSLHDPQELFHTIITQLRLFFAFDSAAIITLDNNQRHCSLFFEMLRFQLPEGFVRYQRPVAGSWIEPHVEAQKVAVIRLRDSLEHFPVDVELRQHLLELGLKQAVLSPLRAGGKVIGFLTFVFQEEQEWLDEECELLATVSTPIAVAVSNALAYEELRKREAQTAMQLAVNNALLTIRERNSMMLAVCEQVQKLLPCTFLGIRVMDKEGNYRLYDNFRLQPDGAFAPVTAALDMENYDSIARASFDLAIIGGYYGGNSFLELCARFPILEHVRQKYGICSFLSLPLWELPASRAGLIISTTMRPFDGHDQATANLIVPQLSLALQNYLAFEEINELRHKLEGERSCLIEEITATHHVGEIIGSSSALTAVLYRLQQVAPTDATVLIQGETGTGKELFARALHNLSARSKRALIKVNCATLPASLIESELFGHEKGSFTGATERRIGKFELAEGGTIFLDEIGELPLELQAKLLRVLQEREFERLGGRHVIRANVRVIAATNRNVEQEVASGRFREDLYFRLNVVPLHVPPLRERRDDIALLANHFANRYAREFSKPNRPIRQNDMQRLLGREWKGNIRELAHMVEQAVILSEGSTLDFATILAPQQTLNAPTNRAISSLRTMRAFEEEMIAMEKQLILDTLEATGGRVSGSGGAAERLAMHPKTLYTRIATLGLSKRYG